LYALWQHDVDIRTFVLQHDSFFTLWMKMSLDKMLMMSLFTESVIEVTYTVMASVV
jgi:hypothetical protein